MANKGTFTARDLTGKNVYHLNNGNQTVYYDSRSKTAYIITNSKASSFSTWQLRGPLCLIGVAILILLRIDMILAILIALFAYILSNIFFRKKFLEEQPINTSFVKPPSKGFVRDIASRYPKMSLSIVCIMFFAIAASLFANQIISKYEGPAVTFNIIFIAINILIGLFIAYIIHIKKKENL